MEASTATIYRGEPGASFESAVITASGTVVGVERTADGVRVVIDGRAGPLYDSVALEAGTSDGSRIAYVGVRAARYHVVVDETEGPPFEGISAQIPPMFSPDGSQFLYGGILGRRCMPVLNGTVGDGVFLAPITPVFSGDGKHLAFVAQGDPETAPGRTDRSDAFGQWVVRDGVPGSLVEGVSALMMSADGGRTVYVATQTEGLRQDRSPSRAREQRATWRVFSDDEPGGEFDDLSPPALAPDGSRLAYAGRRGDRWVMVSDGADVDEGDMIGPPSLSADGSRLAYPKMQIEKRLFKDKVKGRMVIDGVPGPEVDDFPTNAGDPVAILAWSQDGARVAYFAKDEGRIRLIVDQRMDERVFDQVYALSFSPNGTRPVFPAGVGKRWRMFEGEVAGGEFDSVGTPQYASDGSRMVYGAIRGAERVLVIDGVPTEGYDDLLTRPFREFSPDARHIACAAAKDGGWYPWLDGAVGPRFDFASAPGWLDGTVAWAAVAGRELVRIEAPIA